MRIPRIILFTLLLLAGGCMERPTEAEFHYSIEPRRMQLCSLKAGGDLALFYAGHDAPEVPVRVAAGDTVGFLRGTDGRLKAVAGAFIMDVDPEVEGAMWKRLSTDGGDE